MKTSSLIEKNPEKCLFYEEKRLEGLTPVYTFDPDLQLHLKILRHTFQANKSILQKCKKMNQLSKYA
jgi:hypothetical protein